MLIFLLLIRWHFFLTLLPLISFHLSVNFFVLMLIFYLIIILLLKFLEMKIWFISWFLGSDNIGMFKIWFHHHMVEIILMFILDLQFSCITAFLNSCRVDIKIRLVQRQLKNLHFSYIYYKIGKHFQYRT